MSTRKKTDGYRTVRIQEALYDQIEKLTQEPNSFYRSVSEFVHEALRLRLEHTKSGSKD